MPLQLNLSTLDGLLLYATAIFAGFLAALWLGLIFWTQRDIRARSRDRLIALLAPLLVAFLNLPGVVIYLILRPPRTLDEEYQHTLEEEALLTEIEDSPVCPGCGGRTQADWQICPTCHTRLRKACCPLPAADGATLEALPVLRHARPRRPGRGRGSPELSSLPLKSQTGRGCSPILETDSSRGGRWPPRFGLSSCLRQVLESPPAWNVGWEIRGLAG